MQIRQRAYVLLDKQVIDGDGAYKWWECAAYWTSHWDDVMRKSNETRQSMKKIGMRMMWIVMMIDSLINGHYSMEFE